MLIFFPCDFALCNTLHCLSPGSPSSCSRQARCAEIRTVTNSVAAFSRVTIRFAASAPEVPHHVHGARCAEFFPQSFARRPPPQDFSRHIHGRPITEPQSRKSLIMFVARQARDRLHRLLSLRFRASRHVASRRDTLRCLRLGCRSSCLPPATRGGVCSVARLFA